MKITSLILFILLTFTARAQYFYNDIVSMQQANKYYGILKNNNIAHVSAESFDENNHKLTDFEYEKQITDNGKTIKTISKFPSAGLSVTTSYYNNNNLIKTIDSTDNVLTTVLYGYDGDGYISSITTTTDDAVMDSHVEEVHEWHYKSNNIPDYMLRIKNKKDTVLVSFSEDENNNIAEERWQKKGKTLEHYFYYYNDANLLTDIVRYNLKAGRMLPDFLLVWDKTERLAEITQIPQSSFEYTTWLYKYNDKGLKTEDVLYSKQKQLIGSVKYSYK